MIDISNLPVIDVHCHPYHKPGIVDPEHFANSVSFGGASVAYMEQGGVEINDNVRGELQRIKRDTIYFRYMIHQMAGFFDVEPDLEIIIDERNRAVSQDFTGYVKRMYDDCGLTTLITDFGMPLPSIPVQEFAEIMPVEVAPIFRIEPLIANLLLEDIGWDEFRRRYDETISNGLESKKYCGVKSIIAYRTGLDISPLSRTPDQGMEALVAIRRGIGGGAMKKLRDHLLCRAMELCMEYDVPMQIHTGMGDFEVNLVLCRPSLLMDFLRFPTFRACKVLLVHTGYPYHAEAGYMAGVLPRVYCDISEGIPFAANGARRIISEVLEMAPISKVVYGSDAFTAPEINYISAKLGKRALAQSLQDLIEEGMLSEAEAQMAARQILSGNARRLYNLEG
jgi:hypothetical protein